MMSVYPRVLRFKRKYPMTIVFRLRKHAAVVDSILDKDEKVLYAFCGQRNDDNRFLFDSCVVALTNKRIIVGEKRILGYYIINVRAELFNDLKIRAGLSFGHVEIDTVKENIHISNLDKKSLDEIETMIHRIINDDKKRISEENKNS